MKYKTMTVTMTVRVAEGVTYGSAGELIKELLEFKSLEYRTESTFKVDAISVTDPEEKK